MSHRARPMSFSDRQFFVQELVAVRNLAIACSKGEREEGTELSGRCGELIVAVDGVLNELIGYHAYLRVEAWPAKKA